MKYYTTDKIKECHAPYNIIFGGRSNGKSTAICKDLIDAYKEHGECFGRVVRYSTDLIPSAMQGWFGSDYLIDYVKEKWNQQICFNGCQWYFTDWDVEDPYSKAAPKEYFGEIFVLSQEYRYKSSQYPHITRLVLEEFVLMDISQYLPLEFERFLSLVSTINRHRQEDFGLSVWMVGNTLNKANPYFSGLGINLDKLGMVPGSLKILHNRFGTRYAIEYAEMVYDTWEEVPDILKIDGNEIAFEGDFSQDPNVYSHNELVTFLATASPSYAATLIHRKQHYTLYKCLITPIQPGWCIIKEQLRKDSIIINLNNRLIDIDQKIGRTIGHLEAICFDERLCLYEDEAIKYAVHTAIKLY